MLVRGLQPVSQLQFIAIDPDICLSIYRIRTHSYRSIYLPIYRVNVPAPKVLVRGLQPVSQFELSHGHIGEQRLLQDEVVAREEEQVHFGRGGHVGQVVAHLRGRRRLSICKRTRYLYIYI